MSKTKRSRGVTVVRGPSPGPAVVRADGKGKRVYYLIHERQPDRGPFPETRPGTVARVFTVARLGATSAYVVRCDPAVSCECVGWYAHNRCIHTGMLAALVAANRL